MMEPNQFSSQQLPPVVNEPFELKRSGRRKWWRIIGGSIVALLAAGIAFIVWWYNAAQQPVSPTATATTTVVVEEGMTPIEIGYLLQTNGLIRSTLAYRIYLRTNGVEGQLQAGTYEISASESLGSVVEHIISGKTSTFSLTFFPGATLYDPTDIADEKRTDVYTILRRAGYDDREIRDALSATYTSPLFADKPTQTTLEGYVFGETYKFATTATVEEILEHSFEVYYQALADNNIIAGAKQHGLNLYEAITLASIVQREVSGYEDMRKVAQVFYSRLELNMSLGSDVTFIYAANQANDIPRVDFPSPYNTRIHAGLPPGPIATPGIDALKAVADPASTEYLYFLAGEDGKTYFAYTEAEHNENITNHCGDLCN